MRFTTGGNLESTSSHHGGTDELRWPEIPNSLACPFPGPISYNGPMHPLDNATWKALTTHQSKIALVTGMARRFPPEVCVHGALALPLPPAFQDLVRMSPEPVCLFTLQKLQPPAGWTITRAVELIQMVQPATAEPSSTEATPDAASSAAQVKYAGSSEIEDLTAADLPAMSALYEATRPGRQLSPKLYQLGGFVGIRISNASDSAVHDQSKPGQLVAMACLRLHLPGYREISTVGTLPGFEGRGYATALVRELARRIRARGEQPFLTVRTDNERAIGIYQRLGFRERVRIHSTTIQHG